MILPHHRKSAGALSTECSCGFFFVIPTVVMDRTRRFFEPWEIDGMVNRLCDANDTAIVLTLYPRNGLSLSWLNRRLAGIEPLFLAAYAKKKGGSENAKERILPASSNLCRDPADCQNPQAGHQCAEQGHKENLENAPRGLMARFSQLGQKKAQNRLQYIRRGIPAWSLSQILLPAAKYAILNGSLAHTKREGVAYDRSAEHSGDAGSHPANEKGTGCLSSGA